HGLCLRGRSSPDCRSFLSAGETVSRTVSVAASAGGDPRPLAGHACAPADRSRGRESRRYYPPWSFARRIFQRDVCTPRAESRFRPEELALAAVARPSHWSGVRIFLRWSRRARDRSALELLGNDA